MNPESQHHYLLILSCMSLITIVRVMRVVILLGNSRVQMRDMDFRKGLMMPKPFSELSRDQMDSMLRKYDDYYRTTLTQEGEATLKKMFSVDRELANGLKPQDQVEFLAVIELMEERLLNSE